MDERQNPQVMPNKPSTPITITDIRNTMAYMLGAIIGINLAFWTIISIALHKVKQAVQNNTL